MKLVKETLKWYGRHLDNKGVRYFDYSASGFEFCFTGVKATATILSDPQSWDDNTKGVIGVYVSKLNSEDDYSRKSFWDHFDENSFKRFILTENENLITLFESEKPETVVIKVLKISEAAFGYAGLKSVDIEGDLVHPEHSEGAIGYTGFSVEDFSKNKNSKVIEIQNLPSDHSLSCEPLSLEVIGDSITCGYGIEGVFEKDTFTTKQERADKSYAFLTAKKLGAEFNMISWSGIGLISNYIDETKDLPDTHWLMTSLWNYTDKSLSLRLGLEPEIWNAKRYIPDIVIIHLGTNDASYVRKNEDRRLTYVNTLRQMIEAVHRRSPQAKICCCLGAMGQDLCASVEEAAALFKTEFPKVPVKTVKFPVQKDSDGIGADWHPSAITHQKMAEQLAEELRNW